MNRKPTFSIAMATFNGGLYLQEQLNSLATQTMLPCELQVGDDGSSDGTQEIVLEFARTAPFPVHLHENRENLGYGENFLRTAARCKGDWVAFCDQDDIWLPTKLQRVYQVVSNNPRALLVVHDALVFNGDDPLNTRALFGNFENRVFEPLELPAAWFCAGFLQTFKRALLEHDFGCRVGIPHAPSSSNARIDRRPHDTWVPFLANMFGETVMISDQLVRYRRHNRNVTAETAPTRGTSEARKNHSLSYLYLAKWHSVAADALRASASSIPEGQLLGCIKRLNAESSYLEARSIISSAASLKERLSALRRLIGTGAYKHSWYLNGKSLIKDIVVSLGGPAVLRTCKSVQPAQCANITQSSRVETMTNRSKF